MLGASSFMQWTIFLCLAIVASPVSSQPPQQKPMTRKEQDAYMDYIVKKEKLWWAAHDGDEEAVRKAHADCPECINDFYHNETPLGKAAAAGHENIVRLLVELGANVNRHHGSHKRSALKHAAYRGHLHVVKALHELGADLHHEGHMEHHPVKKDAHGWALHMGHDHVAEYLHTEKHKDLHRRREKIREETEKREKESEETIKQHIAKHNEL